MADTPIRALPSYWRGIVFRSRTEARWAAFFDALGLEWVYEPEGYELQDGTWYLPDFWLPQLRLWVEVKPSYGASRHERDKCRMLAEGLGYPVMVTDGQPRHAYFDSYWPDGDEWGGSFSSKGRVWWSFGDGGDPPDDPLPENAADFARRANVRDPDASEVLPMGWEGTGLPF